MGEYYYLILIVVVLTLPHDEWIFAGRASLDILTGDLLIADLRASDSGVYTAVINSIQTQRMDVVVIGK